MESNVRLQSALKLFLRQPPEVQNAAGRLSKFCTLGGWQAGSLSPLGAHAAGVILLWHVDQASADSAAADVPASRDMESGTSRVSYSVLQRVEEASLPDGLKEWCCAG